MTTITLKINERTKAGKAFLAMAETFFKDAKGIEIVETKEEESPYDPEFVAMVKDAAKSKKRTRINPGNVWESL